VATTVVARASARRLFQAKYVMFAVYGLLMIIVWVTRDHLLLVPNSPLRQRYAPVAVLVFMHGFPAAIALFLGILQFSSRLRQRHLQVHRWMGRIYVGCVAIGARSRLWLRSNCLYPLSCRLRLFSLSDGWPLLRRRFTACVPAGSSSTANG